MTDIGSMTTEEALAHYGRKGMKWGVRSSRTNRLDRVASGRSTKGDRALVKLAEVSPKSVKRNQGIEGAAANKVANIRARQARFDRGEASVKDVLAKFGGDRLIDTGRPDKSRRK